MCFVLVTVGVKHAKLKACVPPYPGHIVAHFPVASVDYVGQAIPAQSGITLHGKLGDLVKPVLGQDFREVDAVSAAGNLRLVLIVDRLIVPLPRRLLLR